MPNQYLGFWSDRDISTLRAQWALGKSAERIGEMLSVKRSGHAVGDKAKRLGLPRRAVKGVKVPRVHLAIDRAVIDRARKRMQVLGLGMCAYVHRLIAVDLERNPTGEED